MSMLFVAVSHQGNQQVLNQHLVPLYQATFSAEWWLVGLLPYLLWGYCVAPGS